LRSYLNKSKIIKDTLKFEYRHCSNIVFWLKDPNIAPIAQLSLHTLDKCNQPALPDNIEILKNTPVRKRLLFRITSSTPTEKSFVVKVLTLHLFRLKFKYCWMKYHRYGFAETANLIIAHNRGINVPQVYGYGRIYGSFGLTKKDIVILEDLNHHISFSELLENNKENEEECINLLNRTSPVFVSHYKAACNNWDINPGSVMFDLHDLKLEPLVLDFEYVVFHKKPSLEVLMFLAANFAKGFSDWMNRGIIDSWAAKLLDRVEVENPDVKGKFMKRFDYYMSFPYMPHKERMRIR